MSTITTRAGKGSPLTNNEVDANFTNLNTDKAELSGAAFTGAITTTSTVDGRDVATDGTKLDGIEASADVTDTTNVTAAGALMDSEVTNLAQVKAFDSADYATAVQGTTADAALLRTGGAMTGAITTNSTFDGRDVATDGTKLDGIEAGADVTDTANVTAAGALMDSELTAIASVKALNQGVATGDSPTFAGIDVTGNISNASGDLTLDVAGNINLDADGANVYFNDGGTERYRFKLDATPEINVTGGTFTFKNNTSDADILFSGNDGGSAITALTLDMSNAGRAFFNVGASFSGDVAMGDNNKTKYGQGEDLILYSDGTNGEIEAPNGSLTLDIAGGFAIDADGGQVSFSDGGTLKSLIDFTGNNVEIQSRVTDGDLIFRGQDGASFITALTLDMSDAGTASFNSGIKTGNSGYINIPTASSGNANISFDGSDFNITSNSSSADMNFQTSSQTRMTLGVGGDLTTYPLAGKNVVFNENGVDADFRVETDGADYAFFVDGSTNNIGIQSGTEWALAGGGTASSSSGNSIDMGYDGTIYAGSAYWAGGLKTGTGFFSDASGDRYKRASRQVTQIYQNSQGGSIAFRSQTSSTAGAVISWHDLAFMDRSNVIFNDGGADQDFRVESNGNANMLFVDGGANKVGIGRDPQDNGSTLQVAADATASTDLQLALRGLSNENKKLLLGFDTTSNIASITSFEAGVTHRPLHLQGSEFVWNESGSDHDFRVESDGNANMLFVDGGSEQVKIGASSMATYGNLEVQNSDGRHGIGQKSWSAISGTSHPSRSVDGVMAFNTASAGNQLSIPIVSQANQHRPALIELTFLSGEYNTSGSVKAGFVRLAFQSLNSIGSVAEIDKSGNVASVSSSGMNILINFTSAYTAGQSNYEGVMCYYRVMHEQPQYVKMWDATLN